MHSRPLPVTVAAVLMALLGLANIASPVFPNPEGVPEFVIYSGVVLGVVGLIAVAGLWMLRKWSIWLTIVVSVLNLLSAAPGIPFGPNTALQVAAAVTVVVSALIIVLVVIPTSMRAFVAAT
jgi:uncharacterized membrane protein (DUF2068 family)